MPPGLPSLETSYDPESDLRLVRITGTDIADETLLTLGLADPTRPRMATARNIVDIRSWEYEGSPYELERQVEALEEVFRDGMGRAYVWLTSPGTQYGAAILFRQRIIEAGLGTPQVAYALEDALRFAGVEMADFRRAEARLERVVAPGD